MASTINASTTSGVVTTADTSGILQFQTNSGQTAVTIDTSQNVGIGTTSPGQKLVINGNQQILGGNYLALFEASNNNQWQLKNNSNNLTYTYNSTEYMRIDNTGNVGIGTTLSGSPIPNSVFNVYGLGYSEGGFRTQQVIVNNSTAYNLTPYAGMAFGFKYKSDGSVGTTTGIWGVKENTTDNNYSSALTFGTAANGGSITERMRIDSSGNVGIGISGSSYKLDVNGTGFFRGDVSLYSTTGGAVNSTILYFGSAALSNAASIYSKTDTATAGNLILATSQTGTGVMTERMRVASNGQVLIGTSTNSGRSPPLIISNDSGTTNWAVGPSTGGSTQFYVSAGAGVYLSTTAATSWTANSDINLKNVTGKIENALDAIATLTPAKFTWKADETNTPQVGLIAQEVEKVLPEVVDKNADGYLGVRYTEVVPLLVAAIQEQQTIINDLKSRITALEGAK